MKPINTNCKWCGKRLINVNKGKLSLKDAEAEGLRKVQDQLLSKIKWLEDTVKYGFKEGTPQQHNKARIEALELRTLSLTEALKATLNWAYRQENLPQKYHEYQKLLTK